MTFKEFKRKVETKFAGYKPIYERNAIQYVAHVGHGLTCYSNPYSDFVNCYWNNNFAGQF